MKKQTITVPAQFEEEREIEKHCVRYRSMILQDRKNSKKFTCIYYRRKAA